MSIKDGGPAFPGEMSRRFGQPNDCNEGMTLRDYFAAKAMQGLVATDFTDTADRNGNDGESYVSYIARASYHLADAMLAVREAKP